MLADLDLLLTTVFCTADDLLPQRARNARRRLTDAEVVTLLVAQGGDGRPVGPAVCQAGTQAARAPVPRAHRPVWLSQAARRSHRRDRAGDGRPGARVPGLLGRRRADRLDPG